jgi:cyclopropane-fatty-acyl-phospholipid synthase
MNIKKSESAIGLPFAGKLIELSEQGRLPDSMVRYGIRRLCKKRLRDEFIDQPEYQQDRFQALIEELRRSPIAIETDAANAQHYEVATDFYLASLGKRLKYSCAYYPDSNTTLDQAEEEMLSLYSKRAELDNDQRILELGSQRFQIQVPKRATLTIYVEKLASITLRSLLRTSTFWN